MSFNSKCNSIITIFILAFMLDMASADDSPVSSKLVPVITPKFLEFYFSPKLEQPILDTRKVELGRRLFHDPVLSSNGSVSCASCHNISNGGADARARSIGVSGRPSSRNSPSVLYVGEQISQFWDGRASTLELQMDGPIKHPDEMGNNWPTIERKLQSLSHYNDQFKEIYNSAPHVDDIKDAISTFERSLVYANSSFDKFLASDVGALSVEEQEGASLFVEIGCASCHQGPLLGGSMYQKLGVFTEYYDGESDNSDAGRFNVTHNESDKNFFKVPSLRNIEKTAPYLHDGSIDTLEAIVELMAYYQLGRQLEVDERTKIVAFLKALTDSEKNSPVTGKKLP